MAISRNDQLPSLSIITPSYNQGRFLEQTITSIVSQNYPALEYIVMDGGSTDGSVEIIQKYAASLAHWESAPDGGQYRAVQKGFERSHGEIMAYLNADDVYFPWTLKIVGEVFATFPEVQWLTSSYPASTTADAGFPRIFSSFNRSQRHFFSTRGKLFYKWGFFPQEATFWRRSLWEKAGSRLNTDLEYAGDLELWARFYQHAIPVTVRVPLAMFRIHKSQKTSRPEAYIAEAEKVLANYPSPLWFPSGFIQRLNKLFRSSKSNSNWLGARCDQVDFDISKETWKYKKVVEWRS